VKLFVALGNIAPYRLTDGSGGRDALARKYRGEQTFSGEQLSDARESIFVAGEPW
jgi:hypothetical protein